MNVQEIGSGQQEVGSFRLSQQQLPVALGKDEKL
jgi:hypothetical protein